MDVYTKLLERNSQHMKKLDTMKYSEQELILQKGEGKAFKLITDLGHVSFFGTLI